MKKSIIILSIATLTLIYGCEKNPKINPVSPTKTELLCSQQWILSKFIINGRDTTKAWFESCELDDIYIFKRYGKLWYDDGVSKCKQTDPQIDSSAEWSFTENGTKLKMEETWNIDLLSETKLDLSLISPSGHLHILKMKKN